MGPLIRKILPVYIWLMMPVFANATHIAGGEITYKYLDTNKYLITLSMFVDCYNGSPGAITQDTTAVFAFFDAVTYDLINYDEIYRSSPTRIRELHYNCVQFNTNACVDQYIYQYEKIIDPGDHGVIIAFQRCCRNGTITNLINPQDVGATYWAYIPPDTVVRENSSPYFKKLPPNFLCTNAPLIFDHSAVDPDGDSLVYSLVAPFDGADRFVPRPVPPANPPFANVVYGSPYSPSQMMGATSGLTIHPKTGELRVSPKTIGQFVVGIKVSEYRNGRLISEVLRDYQFNVYDCVFETQANFINPERVCQDTVYFSDRSSKATYYYWDFGIEDRTDDTSQDTSPFWLYPDDGEYKVTLIVGNLGCMDTFYNYVTIVHADSIHAFFDPGNTEDCDRLTLCVHNQGDTTPDWIWDWGDGSGKVYNLDTICHEYTSPGTYYPSLTIVDSSKCNISDVYSIPVQVNPSPVAGFAIDSFGCEGFIRASLKSFGYTGSEWYFGGLDTTFYNDPSPSVKYDSGGSYPVILRVFTDKCADTLNGTVTIDMENFVSADIMPSLDPRCVPVDVHFSSPPGMKGNNIWDMGDGVLLKDTGLTKYTYTVPGVYTITFLVTDTNSCNINDSATFTLTIYGETEPDFNIQVDICSDEIIATNKTDGGQEFFWNFGDGSTSPEEKTNHRYLRTGRFFITLTVDSSGPCPSRVTKAVDISKPGLDELFIPNIFTPNDDQFNDCFAISGVAQACFDYTFIVYNRWGELVFESHDIGNCWDGHSQRGEPLPEGTYFAIYELDNRLDGEKQRFSGTITLIR